MTRVFKAGTLHVDVLYQLINSISPFGNTAVLEFTKDKICISVNDNQVCKVKLNLGKALFEEWDYYGVPGLGEETEEEDEGEEEGEKLDVNANCYIGIDLATILDTLNIHVNEELKLRISYSLQERLVLEFEDDAIKEICSINTFVVNEDVKDDGLFYLDFSNVSCEIVLKSAIFYEILKDMKDLHTDQFSIYFLKAVEEFNDQNKLIFISKSKYDSIGYSKLIVPQRRSNIQEFKLFKQDASMAMVPCLNLSFSTHYYYQNFSRLLKAIKSSRIIKLRRDVNGITSILLLLGSNKDSITKAIYNGSSIEFMTLECVTTSAGNGYNDIDIEKLIKDDESIQTIRVGGDGKLTTTIDDYFTTATSIPITKVAATSFNQEVEPTDQDLVITEEIAQTLLGTASTTTAATANLPQRAEHAERSPEHLPNADVQTVGGAVEIPLFI